MANRKKKKEDLTQRARNGESCCCCCSMGVHVLHQMVLYINSRSTPEWNTRAAEVSFFSFNFKGLVCDVFYLVHDDELGSLFFFFTTTSKVYLGLATKKKEAKNNERDVGSSYERLAVLYVTTERTRFKRCVGGREYKMAVAFRRE